METLTACPGCGALVQDLPHQPHPYIGASAGCWEVFGEILAREYGEYNYPERAHRLTVDTYAVQHPGMPNRRAIQSVTGHLISLYLLLEANVNGRAATQALRAIFRQADHFTWLEPPQPNGRITVLDVVQAGNLAEHERRVEAWARDVWGAWAAHHAHISTLAARCLP